MRIARVGFYWTLPVNWAGFRDLPPDVEEAALESRTIRYQVERVRSWAKAEAIALTDEVAFLDVQPDRATEACKEALSRARSRCEGDKFELVYVDFAQVSFWRHNIHLIDHAEELGFDIIGLPPTPISMDGELFDPVEHFRRWRKLEADTKSQFRLAAAEGLERAIANVPTQKNYYGALATWLNDVGIKTTVGNSWTAEGVRKILKRR